MKAPLTSRHGEEIGPSCLAGKPTGKRVTSPGASLGAVVEKQGDEGVQESIDGTEDALLAEADELILRRDLRQLGVE
jgi:hypothetical protein